MYDVVPSILSTYTASKNLVTCIKTCNVKEHILGAKIFKFQVIIAINI